MDERKYIITKKFLKYLGFEINEIKINNNFDNENNIFDNIKNKENSSEYRIQYVNSDTINSLETKQKIISLLPYLRHFYKTSTCRSITFNGKSKNEVSNLLRQILKSNNLKLKSKTFCTKINNKITTRTKYYIDND